MKFYYDKDKTAVAATEGKMETLANFLQSDIQQDAELARQLLNRLDKNPSYEMIGNSHELELKNGTVEIRNQLDDEFTVYDLKQVQESLQDWLDFITA